MLEIIIDSEDEMRSLAEAIAPYLKKGDVITLKGDLGAGKTFFARNLINFLTNKRENVPSPTFTLVQIYNTEKFPIYHFDLYRLKKAEEVYELGIEDAFYFGLSIIEWPQIIDEMLPKNLIDIEIEFLPEEYSRKICIKAYDPVIIKSLNNKLF